MKVFQNFPLPDHPETIKATNGYSAGAVAGDVYALHRLGTQGDSYIAHRKDHADAGHILVCAMEAIPAGKQGTWMVQGPVKALTGVTLAAGTVYSPSTNASVVAASLVTGRRIAVGLSTTSAYFNGLGI
jgi:hypothetical protein